MIIKSKDINKEIRLMGEFLRVISPLDKKWFQTFASPLSTKVLSVLQLKGLNCEKTYIKRADGTKFRVCIFKSNVNDGKRAGVLWLHGGGYALGAPEMVCMSFARELIKKTNCVLISPDYALSAQSPYPAALNDAYDTLKWIDSNRDFLGIEREKLVVGGESAGGGLTASLCIYARDKGFNNIGIQLPLYPMLDDRPTESSKNNDAPVWNTKANKSAWQIYLGDKYLNVGVPSYAAPARETDYNKLPSALSFIGTVDPFYSETVIYFRNLKNANVESDYFTVGGGYHAFDMMCPNAQITKQAYNLLLEKYNSLSDKCL